MDHNILEDPVIRFSTSNGSTTHASLPVVLAALIRDEVDAFPALRPHQRHAWHAFLAQLGALAIHRAGLNEPPDSAGEWRRIVRGLTPGFPDDEPWHLVVEDIIKPAFMQPPARSDDKLKEYNKTPVLTPDGLDMLVLSKNHDIKSAVAARAEADDWIFALITLQTMEGFSGPGNYNISRMNGGFGSRAAFSLSFSTRSGAHLRRDLVGLMERQTSLVADYPMRDDGFALIWAEPWDGTKSEALLLNQLNPYYIEICRRIRLRVKAGGELYGIKASSKAARIEAKNLKGITGDPWMPINRKENKSLNLASGGFTYDRVTEYLTPGNWEQPALLRPIQSEKDASAPALLLARALVRGQGKTEGYYERIIPINARVKKALTQRESMNELGRIAQERIADVGEVKRILSHAIRIFASRGDSNSVSTQHGNLARPWLNRLDEWVDTRFFDDLQAEFDNDDIGSRNRIRKEWLMDEERGVVNQARRILQEAMEALPCPAIHRYRARANAESLFYVRVRGPRGLASRFADPDQGGDA